MKLRVPSPAMVVAVVAVLVAMSGSAIAASVITSSQIKNGTIQVKDLSKSAIARLHGSHGATGAAGAVGPTGAPGSTGAPGPSDVFSVSHSGTVALPNDATPFSMSLGAGKYVIFGKLEVNNNSTITARPDCKLIAGGDRDEAQLGTSTNLTEDDTATATLTVAHTFTGTGTVTLGCTDDGMAANGGGTMEKVRITAIKSGSLTSQEF